jgi:hypothetical protein
MDPKEKEDRRAKLIEGARKQLAEGTWPKVMAIFGYTTPRAVLRSKEEFGGIKAVFEKAGCTNLAAFTDLVFMDEKRKGVPMSFNLSMSGRFSPGDPEATVAASIFSCPDIMVGTRGGIESAFESMQIFDKIFGEAIEHMKSPPESTSVEKMLEEVFTPPSAREAMPPDAEKKSN